MTELRELSEQNFDEIKELFRSVFSAPPWNEDWSDDARLSDYLFDLIKVRTPVDLGLYEDGRLVGISVGCIKHWCSGTEYYLEELFIRTDAQGRGLGTEFIRLIEQYLKARDIGVIFLTTQRTHPAYSFYKKLGFNDLDGFVALVKGF